MKRFAALVALLAHAALAPAQEGGIDAGNWDFTATLDGKPIGTHRFAVSTDGTQRSIDSRAQFVVRVLGIPVYRYRHEAQERWQGDCLRELHADTDDDGQRRQVAQRFDTECLMGFAYWSPRLAQQSRLVDPQTGRIEPVRFEAVPDASIDVRGRATPAHGWRLVADHQRIVVWYAADTGRWIALDAEAKGGRRLSYRLQTEKTPP